MMTFEFIFMAVTTLGVFFSFLHQLFLVCHLFHCDRLLVYITYSVLFIFLVSCWTWYISAFLSLSKMYIFWKQSSLILLLSFTISNLSFSTTFSKHSNNLQVLGWGSVHVGILHISIFWHSSSSCYFLQCWQNTCKNLSDCACIHH